MSRLLTRRRALSELTLGGAALYLAACGAGSTAAGGDGSTLRSTWSDPDGDGMLSPGPAIALTDRTELAQRSAPALELGRLAHLTDAHLLDAQSPARVTFLDRLGQPFTSTFRPQEALTAVVLDGAVNAINAFAPHAVIQGGDLIDNAQANELAQAMRILGGGNVRAVSGSGGYVGVQQSSNPDPFYYRPGIDAPTHPALLRDALEPFSAIGLRAPVYPVLGDHDILVAGVLPPSDTTQAIAVGTRAVWELPTHLDLPRIAARAASAPDGLSDPETINSLIGDLAQVPSVAVPADLGRRELGVSEVLAGLHATPDRDAAGLLDYRFDVGTQLRVIVLDLARREGGSGGLIHDTQPAWLAGELERAETRWVIVVSHQPLDTSAGGQEVLSLLDRHPRTLAAIWGHTHRNRVTPRRAPNGGYWLVSTASLIDYPQQARALRVHASATGGAILETWMLDHTSPRTQLGQIARELSFLDAQGGRPQDFSGSHLDGNVRLFRGPPGSSS